MKKVFQFCSNPLVLAAISLSLVGCSTSTELSSTSPTDTASSDIEQTGLLEFRANGEDFVRQGFQSKDGWQIEFEHLYVTLEELTAHRDDAALAKPASSALAQSTGSATESSIKTHLKGGKGATESVNGSGDAVAIAIPGAQTVDLALGGEDADPILVQSREVPAVHFKGLSWKLAPAITGPAQGQTLQLVGMAKKDGQQVDFKISWDQAYAYRCGEFIGDQRKGIVKPGDTSDVEATFHFDHLFGDASVAETEKINTKALGFEPFASFAADGVLEIDRKQLEDLLSSEEFAHLDSLFLGLGHVGEGHCDAEVVG